MVTCSIKRKATVCWNIIGSIKTTMHKCCKELETAVSHLKLMFVFFNLIISLLVRLEKVWPCFVLN